MSDINPELQVAIDKRLEEALVAGNYQITLNLQKQNIKLSLESKLIYAVNGGLFRVTPELISFVSALNMADREQTVLLDSNSNPIEIVNLHEFLDTIVDIYHEHMNEYLFEFKSFQKKRNPKALLGV
jgi:hypothetical protein